MALTIDPWRLAPGVGVADLPMAILDLEAIDSWPEDWDMPPCPLVAIGNPAHPLAARCDALVENPVRIDSLIAQCSRQPAAAGILVDVLRTVDSLTREAGLTAESLAYATLQGSSGHRKWLAARSQGKWTAEGRVTLERNGDVLAVTLDRAVTGNAIDRAMRDALDEALTLAAMDADVARIELLGAGRCFSLGADLNEFGTTTDPATAHAIRRQTLPARSMLRCRKPVLARIQGACVGAGLELAAFADWTVATPDAWFQLPELAMGIIPGAGGCVSLPRRIGRQRTALMVLSGRRISARTALAWGLVDEIVDASA